MAPKKHTLKKGTSPLKKGSPKTAPLKKGSPKSKSLAKAKAKAATSKVKKHTLKPKKLCKKNLDKLPEMSLQEKVEQAASEAEGDPEAAAAKLKTTLNAKEKQSVWSKHQTWLKSHPKDAKALQKATKKEKGEAASLWLMKQQGAQFLSCSAKVTQEEALKKAENWESEKQILKKWSWEEMQLHLSSGRLIWRQDPYSPGVWEYQDTQAWQKETKVSRGKRWEFGSDHQAPSEEVQEGFTHLYDQEAFGMAGHMSSLYGKGSGKSSSSSLAKGKGKGKKGNQLAIEDQKEEENEEEAEEDDAEGKVAEALRKVRKCRDQTMSSLSDLEQALKKAAPQLSTKGKGGALATQLKLEKQLKQAKALLLKQCPSFSDLKKFLDDSAKALKSAKDDIKELNQIGNKAESTSGKSSSSKKSKQTK